VCRRDRVRETAAPSERATRAGEAVKLTIVLLRRLALRLAWLLGNLRWLAGRGPRTKLHRGPIKGLVACEACEVREATVVIFSPIAGRDIHFCEWDYRRWKKANQARAMPKSRKPKKKGGRPGGRAA
jgi:hypothetical protein